MTRITPGTGQNLDIEQLENHEPYKGTLKKIDWSDGLPEYGTEKRLTLDWELDNGDSVRDWISPRLGKQKNGTVSKLRQLLNALSEKESDTQVEWFDPDTLEWSYVENGAAFNKLKEGDTIIFRGLIGKRADGQGRKYTINVYQQIPKDPPTAAKGSKLKPAPVPSSDNAEIPF